MHGCDYDEAQSDHDRAYVLMAGDGDPEIDALVAMDEAADVHGASIARLLATIAEQDVEIARVTLIGIAALTALREVVAIIDLNPGYMTAEHQLQLFAARALLGASGTPAPLPSTDRSTR